MQIATHFSITGHIQTSQKHSMYIFMQCHGIAIYHYFTKLKVHIFLVFHFSFRVSVILLIGKLVQLCLCVIWQHELRFCPNKYQKMWAVKANESHAAVAARIVSSILNLNHYVTIQLFHHILSRDKMLLVTHFACHKCWINRVASW